MKRRLLLALTALAIVGGGTGVASASTPGQSPAVGTARQHQFCVIVYNDDGSIWRYLCVNY